jgi:hypothetical protein
MIVGDISRGRLAKEVSEVLLCATGQESRARCLAEQIRSKSAQIVVAPVEQYTQGLARSANDSTFRDAGFRVEEASSESSEALVNVLDSNRDAIEDRGLIVDLSCMFTNWTASIVRWLTEIDVRWLTEIERANRLKVSFVYTPGLLSTRSPRRRRINETVEPLDGFASLADPTLPVALVIGVGYEAERALGLAQFIDPALRVICLPTTGSEDYDERVRQSNAEIIREAGAQWIVNYPFGDPVSSLARVESLVGGLGASYRVVLASLGPKLFGLYCMLIATRNMDVSVFRAAAQPVVRDVIPDWPTHVVCGTTWISKDEWDAQDAGELQLAVTD